MDQDIDLVVVLKKALSDAGVDEVKTTELMEGFVTKVNLAVKNTLMGLLNETQQQELNDKVAKVKDFSVVKSTLMSMCNGQNGWPAYEEVEKKALSEELVDGIFTEWELVLGPEKLAQVMEGVK
jgi:hypothetical protein